MIQRTTATVFYSPAARRRYFSLHGAATAEARAKILKKYPVEPYEEDTGAGYDIRFHEPGRYEKLLLRMVRIIKKNYRKMEAPK